MVRESVLGRVCAIVAHVLQVPLVTVTPDAVLAQLGNLDSLKLAEILAALDDEFRTHVPGEGLTTVTSVGELAELVEKSPS